MEQLKKLGTQTTWEVASDAINYNGGLVKEAIVRLEMSTYKGKGYFGTEQQLRDEIPSATPGSWAFVGTEYPFVIYEWNKTASDWVNTGIEGGQESLVINGYYTKEESHREFVASDTVRRIETRYTQAQIEQMEKEGTLDQNTLYIAFE